MLFPHRRTKMGQTTFANYRKDDKFVARRKMTKYIKNGLARYILQQNKISIPYIPGHRDLACIVKY